jgi:AraC-like DNA-binding protein
MNIKNTIRKLLSGSEINALERAELESYDPDILSSQLDGMRTRVTEIEREKLGEKERLELDIAEITRERDELKADRNRLLRSRRIQELAESCRFNDPEYLDYLAGKADVDLYDDEAAQRFISELQVKRPESFISSLKSGSGSGVAPEEGAATGNTLNSDRIGKIISDLETAPHIN